MAALILIPRYVEAVARQYADHINPHFAGQVAKNNLSAVQLDAKNSIRQILNDFALKFNDFLLV